MDKKFKFSEQTTRAKILYAAVIAILTVTAIVIAIVSVASRNNDELPSENPPVTDGGDSGNSGNGGDTVPEPEKPEAVTYAFPLEGEISKGHSTDIPVFSTTLGDFRIHTGIDISADEGATVRAAADGTVSKVYYDPFGGQTVEISHSGGVTSRYSNLDKEVSVKVGDSVKRGDSIGTVGDTSLSELADEAHLHFEINVNGSQTDPVEFIANNK